MRIVLFDLLTPLLLLALQDVAGQELALGIGHVDELGANLEIAFGARVAVGDAATQQQAVGAWHQHHLHLDPGAGRDLLRLGELDTAFGDDHPLRLADLADQRVRDYRAEQVEAFVLGAQEGSQGTVLVAELAQQVLGFEVRQVQFAEQVEQR